MRVRIGSNGLVIIAWAKNSWGRMNLADAVVETANSLIDRQTWDAAFSGAGGPVEVFEKSNPTD
ncbi:hypothetical protein StoSoilA2_11730 [Arthrobacter sp. StoSoilA2]|nr:hypothetical protein StoSoilA2_11730 [Arthrobacter sp. StoSoilA2]